MSTQIPDSHRDLIEGAVVATAATILPNGMPHLSVVWYSYDGTHVLVNSTEARQKTKNLRRNPNITFLAIDPANPHRYLEIRGVVDEEIGGEAAVDNISAHAKKYKGVDNYYGDFAPAERRNQETRILFKVKPTKVLAYG